MPKKYERMNVGWWTDQLPKMTQVELADLQRFAPAGHIVFCNARLLALFNIRFQQLGGMTPEISKTIGWK